MRAVQKPPLLRGTHDRLAEPAPDAPLLRCPKVAAAPLDRRPTACVFATVCVEREESLAIDESEVEGPTGDDQCTDLEAFDELENGIWCAHGTPSRW